jgi:hypothetical protein
MAVQTLIRLVRVCRLTRRQGSLTSLIQGRVKHVTVSLLVFSFCSFLGSTRKAPFAGSGPVIQAGIGYAYINMSMPSSSRFGLSGADASANADLTRRFGVKLDLCYSRGFNVFGRGRHADVH